MYEEYTVIEKKPNRVFPDIYSLSMGLRNYDEVEVIKKRVEGVSWVSGMQEVFFSFKLIPKLEFQNLKHYAICFTFLFSKKDVVIFYSIESLKLQDWNETAHPQCLHWQQYKLLLNTINKNSLDDLREKINTEIIGRIEDNLLNN